MVLLRILTMSVTLAIAALPVSQAFAQVGGGFGGGFGGRSHGNRNGEPGGERKPNADKAQEAPDPNSYEQINYRLSLIQEDIKPEPGQLDAWLGFASKVRAYAADVAREKSQSSASSLQAVGLQHIGQVMDTARNRLTALEDVESAAKRLYPILKPEQKVLLDMRIPTVVAPRSSPPGLGGRP